MYALGRIKKCRILDQGFVPREDLKIEDYLDPMFGIYTNEGRVDIAVKFYPPVASLIKERQWHPDQIIEDLDDGSIILKFTSNQQSQTLYWVSQWGPRAEILEPMELRDKAATWFRETEKLYFSKK